jgi:hypothetical protein
MLAKAWQILRRRHAARAQVPIPSGGGDEAISFGSSAIHLQGSFARRRIAQGELIRHMSGEVVGFKEVRRRIRKGKLTPDDPLQISPDLFIDLDPASLAINHSCSPNAGIRAQNELIAIRDIETGEEITFDYSTTVSKYVDPASWTMRCSCNAENCRSDICNVMTVPREQLLQYIQMNALQSYIFDEIAGCLKD